MTIFSRFRQHQAISYKHFPQPLKKIARFLFKNRLHVIILVFTMVYLAVAPGIIAGLFVTAGQPENVNVDLPPVTNLINFSIDNTNGAMNTTGKVYHIGGWAFLTGEPDQTVFDRYLVLNSRHRAYYFPLETIERQDVLDAFQDLDLNILNSGFQATVSVDALQSGTYNIGFLFKGKSLDESYYSYSNRYLIRTPNTDSVEIGLLPEDGMVSISSDRSRQYGRSIKFDALTFGTGKQIQAFMDHFSNIDLAGKQYGRLAGWAFLENEAKQSQYKRYIVLESDKDTFYFPVTNVDRPDVQSVFPELKSRYSGFNVDILTEALPIGVYKIGIIFGSRVQGENYYTMPSWTITRTATEISFED